MKVRCPKRDCPYHECDHYDWHKDRYQCNHVIYNCRETGDVKSKEPEDVICASKRNKRTRKKKPKPPQPEFKPAIETSDDYRKKQGYTSSRDYWEKQGVLSKQGILGRFPDKK